MLKIGDFSKLGQVSVRMLRHYDQLGLLNPDQIDKFTGYRYYAVEQLARLNRILFFKDLGFSLQQIKELLLIRSSQWPKWLSYFGFLVAASLLLNLLEVIGIDMGAMITVSVTLLHFWMLATAIVFLRKKA